MDRPHNDVSTTLVIPRGDVNIIKPAGIGKAVMVEEGSSGIDAIGPHGSLGGGWVHEAKGIALVLGK